MATPCELPGRIVVRQYELLLELGVGQSDCDPAMNPSVSIYVDDVCIARLTDRDFAQLGFDFRGGSCAVRQQGLVRRSR
jgi:hypothetical protein